MLNEINKHINDSYITFIENSHIYRIDGIVIKHSVSQLIEKIFQPFDCNKALDNIIKNGGSKYEGKTKEEILNMWNELRLKSSHEGSYLHSLIDKYLNNNLKEPYENVKEFSYFLNYFNILKNRNYSVYRSEWVIYNGNLNVAGTLDAIFKDEDGLYHLYDWKRVSKLYTNKRYDRYLLRNQIKNKNIPDDKFLKYSFQLNVYKYILETNYNINISSMWLVLLHPENKNFIEIEIRDMKFETELIFDSI